MADPPKRSATFRPIKAWNIETLRAFLDLTSGDDLRPLWMLLATTGLRRGEALGLRWSDVDLNNGRAHATQTMIAIGWQVLCHTWPTIALQDRHPPSCRSRTARPLEHRDHPAG